jgi:hypothetical protein
VTSQSDEIAEQQQAWKLLSKAGLVEISLDEFPERIRQVKLVVMSRLSELLERKNRIQERNAVAYSLGTLKNLEATLLGESPPADPVKK